MRRVAAVALIVVVTTACRQTPEAVLEAGVTSTAILEQTVTELFPSHAYEITTGGPTSAWCDDADQDGSEVAVLSKLAIDLAAGDDPVAMAMRLVDYWRREGRVVDTAGLGTSYVVGASYGDDGDLVGYTAVDNPDDAFDVLELSSVTACYPRP
jgi:hypothetical protein